MKTTAQIPSDASAPEVVLSEARKQAAFRALRQRYEEHDKATGLKSGEAFAQLQAGQGAK